MDVLASEFRLIKESNFQLKFDVPTAEQLKHMRSLHRDMSDAERRQAKKAKDSIRDAVAAIEAGGDALLQSLDLPESDRKALEKLVAKGRKPQ